MLEKPKAQVRIRAKKEQPINLIKEKPTLFSVLGELGREAKIRFDASKKAPGEIRELFAMVRRNAVTASSPHLSIGDKFVVNQRGKARCSVAMEITSQKFKSLCA